MLIALVLFIAFPGIVNAQRYEEMQHIDSTFNRMIKVYPLLLGEVRVGHEHMLTTRIANEVAFSYLYTAFLKGADSDPESQPVQGGAIRMSQRRYSLQNQGRPLGFFHGFTFGYRFMVYEQDVFRKLSATPDAPVHQGVGRMYQNALDLGYQVGMQFKLIHHLTADVAASLGGRVKYVAADDADKLLTDHIIGHAVAAERNSAIFVTPLPQLNLSVGYAF